jgi:Protein of unknown function (DUF2630)
MDDESILRRINALIDREHELRTGRQNGTVGQEAEVRELVDVEVELDQCWDLLRQRRAKRDFGRDADEAEPRSPNVVERYWQ